MLRTRKKKKIGNKMRQTQNVGGAHGPLCCRGSPSTTRFTWGTTDIQPLSTASLPLGGHQEDPADDDDGGSPASSPFLTHSRVLPLPASLRPRHIPFTSSRSGGCPWGSALLTRSLLGPQQGFPPRSPKINGRGQHTAPASRRRADILAAICSLGGLLKMNAKKDSRAGLA